MLLMGRPGPERENGRLMLLMSVRQSGRGGVRVNVSYLPSMGPGPPNPAFLHPFHCWRTVHVPVFNPS